MPVSPIDQSLVLIRDRLSAIGDTEITGQLDEFITVQYAILVETVDWAADDANLLTQEITYWTFGLTLTWLLAKAERDGDLHSRQSFVNLLACGPSIFVDVRVPPIAMLFDCFVVISEDDKSLDALNRELASWLEGIPVTVPNRDGQQMSSRLTSAALNIFSRPARDVSTRVADFAVMTDLSLDEARNSDGELSTTSPLHTQSFCEYWADLCSDFESRLAPFILDAVQSGNMSRADAQQHRSRVRIATFSTGRELVHTASHINKEDLSALFRAGSDAWYAMFNVLVASAEASANVLDAFRLPQFENSEPPAPDGRIWTSTCIFVGELIGIGNPAVRLAVAKVALHTSIRSGFADSQRASLQVLADSWFNLSAGIEVASRRLTETDLNSTEHTFGHVSPAMVASEVLGIRRPFRSSCLVAFAATIVIIAWYFFFR